MKFSWHRKRGKLLYHTVASFLLYIYRKYFIVVLLVHLRYNHKESKLSLKCNLLTKLSAKTEKVSNLFMEISNLCGFSTNHFPEVDNNRREVKHGWPNTVAWFWLWATWIRVLCNTSYSIQESKRITIQF